MYGVVLFPEKEIVAPSWKKKLVIELYLGLGSMTFKSR